MSKSSKSEESKSSMLGGGGTRCSVACGSIPVPEIGFKARIYRCVLLQMALTLSADQV